MPVLQALQYNLVMLLGCIVFLKPIDTFNYGSLCLKCIRGLTSNEE